MISEARLKVGGIVQFYLKKVAAKYQLLMRWRLSGPKAIKLRPDCICHRRLLIETRKIEDSRGGEAPRCKGKGYLVVRLFEDNLGEILNWSLGALPIG